MKLIKPLMNGGKEAREGRKEVIGGWRSAWRKSVALKKGKIESE